MSFTRAGRHARMGLVALAAMLCLPAPRAATAVPTIGVLIAPAGERLAELEALYADALVAQFVAADLHAVFLHESSPLVRARGAALPSVAAGDDWTPLGPVLDRLAARLRLDYVLLTAIRERPEAGPVASGLVVARGGATRTLAAAAVEASGDAGASAAAETMAARVTNALGELGEPRDPVDEPIAAIPGEQAPPSAADTAGAGTDAPRPSETVETPAEPATPGAPATPATGPEETGEDPLAPAREAYEAGDYLRASALLDSYERERGASGASCLLRARISLARHNRELAVDHLRDAVALQPDLVEAQVWLAQLLAEQGRWQIAMGHYEAALEVAPTHLEGLLGLARLCRDHGHRKRALELLSAADELGQRDPSVLTLLGELHGAEGNVELAERYFLRAVAGTTGERTAAVLERLGDLYADLGRHRDALSCYLRAADLNPSRSAMVQRRYLEVMAAADSTVYEALTAGWSVFEDYSVNGIGEREMVYRRLGEVRAQVEEAVRFCQSVRPPADLRVEHAQREFAYSLAVEAVVAGISYLDLGDQNMRERAAARHLEAIDEFDALRGGIEG